MNQGILNRYQIGIWIGVLFVAWWLLLLPLAEQSITGTEAHNAWIIRDSLRRPDTLREALHELRAGFAQTAQRAADSDESLAYLLLIDTWTALFTHAPASLRLPSAMLGLFALASMYMLGRQLFSRGVALLAMLLLLTSILYLFYARQANDDILSMVAILLATAAYSRWLQLKTQQPLHRTPGTPGKGTQGHGFSLAAIWGVLRSAAWQMLALYAVLMLFAVLLAPLHVLILVAHGIHYFVLERSTMLQTRFADAQQAGEVAFLVLWGVLSLPIAWRFGPVVLLPPWFLLLAYRLSRLHFGMRFVFVLAFIVVQWWLLGAGLPEQAPYRPVVQQAAAVREALEPGLHNIDETSALEYYDRIYQLTKGNSVDIGWRPFTTAEINETAANLRESESVWLVLPTDTNSSWDALAALYANRGLGYWDSVGGTLIYRLDQDSDLALSLTFADIFAFGDQIGQQWQARAGEELCVTIPLRSLENRNTPYELQWQLTGRAQAVVARTTSALNAPIRSAPEGCLSLPADLAAGTYHLRLSVLDVRRQHLLPVLDYGLQWGDSIVPGTVRVRAN